jgi:glycosyltransferase 2 family protein
MWLFKLSVSGGILYYIFTIVPVAEVFTALRSSRIGFFLVALSFMFMANMASALRMRQLTMCQGMSVSVSRIFEINLISNFYGMFLPGSLAGGAVRWRKLYLADKNASGAFIAIILSRFLLTTVTVALGVLFWLSAGQIHSNRIVGLVLLGILAGLLLLQGILVSGVVSLPFNADMGSEARGGSRLLIHVVNVLGALGRYRDLPRIAFLRISVLALIDDLLGIVSFYFASLSVGIDVPLVHLGWVRSFLQLITMVPVSFFGIGIQEGTLITLLGNYGVPGAEAVAFSFILVARSIVIAFTGGLLELRNLLVPAR